MTIQVSPSMLYNDKEYTILTQKYKIELNLRDYGFHPSPLSSACWDGYECVYTIYKGILCLHEILINEADSNFAPIFCGHSPSKDTGPSDLIPRQLTYTNLKFPISYTGTLYIASDYTEYGETGKYYSYSSLNYQTIISLTFKNGLLASAIDYSLQIKQARKYLIDKNPDVSFLSAADLPESLKVPYKYIGGRQIGLPDWYFRSKLLDDYTLMRCLPKK